MQSLIPLILALSLASAGTPLNLIPYAYLSSPLPVYQQYLNTRTGEHAYSYAGGPSAKEEIKDADGVLRGSYSYIDANGILQSVFYVADDNGFRVAATNLPSDDNVHVEPAHIVLARSTQSQENSKSRKRRSLIVDALQSSDQNEQNPSSSSSPQQTEESSVPKSEDIATGKALYQPLLLSSDVPLATSHQSQVQVHSNARVDLTELEAKPVDLQPILPVQTILGGLPVLSRTPTYQENRIELHKNLGIEGAAPKDAVKIDAEPLTLVQSHPLPVASTIIAKQAVPLVPVLGREAVPVLSAGQLGSATATTSVSSYGVSQIHGPSEQYLDASGVIAKEAVPVLAEGKEVVPLVPLVKESPSAATATATATISSHGISQVHGDARLKIEPTLLVRTVPIAHLHPVIELPVSVLG